MAAGRPEIPSVRSRGAADPKYSARIHGLPVLRHQLARQLQVPTNRITAIINGQRAITGDTALRLAHFFGTSAEFWLNLQSLYDLRGAEQKAGKSIKTLPKLKRREPLHA